MTRRATFRGSPAQAASNRKYWLGVAANATCMLLFSGLMIAALFLVLDRLAS